MKLGIPNKVLGISLSVVGAVIVGLFGYRVGQPFFDRMADKLAGVFSGFGSGGTQPPSE
jgi:hypothetical protein